MNISMVSYLYKKVFPPVKWFLVCMLTYKLSTIMCRYISEEKVVDLKLCKSNVNSKKGALWTVDIQNSKLVREIKCHLKKKLIITQRATRESFVSSRSLTFNNIVSIYVSCLKPKLISAALKAYLVFHC